MKNSLKRWVGRVPDLSAVLTRFPLPASLMALFTLGLIFKDSFRGHDAFEFVMAGFIIAAYLCVSFTVWRESSSKTRGVLIQAVIAAIVLLLAYFAETLRLQPAMAIGAAILILGNAIIFRQGRDDLRVWDFTHKIWTGAAFATLGSIIFVIGVLAIMAALKSLFGIDIDDLVEDFLMPVGLGLLAPLYWLSTVPGAAEPADDLTENPGFVSKAVAFMGTWILSPLTLIYALIIAAYGVKIILAGELPKGEIAQLVTPFLIIGTLTWLLLFPPFIREKFLAKLYRKVWFFLSIPAAILLSISVGVRVSEYGLTEERIALILCCVWALGIGVWFVFGPKTKRDIRLVPGFAALLFGIGTFASLNLSVANQFSRMQTNLVKAGIMSEAGIVTLQSDIAITDKDAARKAKGALQYLSRHGAHENVFNLFKNTKDIGKMTPDNFSDLYARLGLENISANARHSVHYQYDREGEYIDINGADKLFGVFNVSFYDHQSGKAALVKGDISVFRENGILSVEIPAESVDVSFDLQSWMLNQPRQGTRISVENPVQTLLKENGRKIELIVNRMNYSLNGDEGMNWSSADFVILTTGF